MDQMLSIEPKRTPQLQKLIDISHADPIDFLHSLDWEMGVDRTKPPKLPEYCWLFGTPFYDELTAEQRHELLWLETARDITMFLTLERQLPGLYTGYVNQYEDDIAPEIYDYLMIFSREEITHTLMFKRYQKMAGLPQFNADPMVAFAQEKLPTMAPVVGVLLTLLLEWTAELGAIFATQHKEVDPLTRELFRRHHIDEARHIAFARWIVESQFEVMAESDVAAIRILAREQYLRLVRGYTFHPDIAQFTSFEYPVKADDIASIKAVRFSDHNIAINLKRFAPMKNWLKKVGVL